MRDELKNDILKLLSGGVDLMELYRRFGAILFKAKILESGQTIEKLSGKNEKSLTDLVDENAIL